MFVAFLLFIHGKFCTNAFQDLIDSYRGQQLMMIIRILAGYLIFGQCLQIVRGIEKVFYKKDYVYSLTDNLFSGNPYN